MLGGPGREKKMIKFEVGKTYRINGAQFGAVKVVKRSKHFVTVQGIGNEIRGRFEVYSFGENGFFGMGENILLPSGVAGVGLFCFAKMGVKE